MKKETGIFLLILILGFFLRFFDFPERMVFDADQEFFAFEARNIILNHKFTLIGIPTQTGSLFIGPLFTYFISFFLLITKLNPVGLSYSSMFVFITDLLIIYFVISRLINYRIANIFCFIYAFSFRFITYSLIPWPITPIFSLSLAFFYFLNKKNYFITFFLLGLGIHLHPQVLLLFFPLIIYLLNDIRQKKLDIKQLFRGILIFGLFISPLLVFTLKHHFLPMQNVINLSFITAISLKEKIITLVSIFSDSIRSIFYPTINIINPLLRNTSGFFIILICSLFLSKDKLIKQVNLVTLCITVSALFYPQKLSDYHLYLSVPLILLILLKVVDYIYLSKLRLKKLIIFCFFLLLFIFNLHLLKTKINPYPLKIKQEVVTKVIENADKNPFAVSYISDPGLNTGYSYLFNYQGVDYIPSTKDTHLPVYTLVIPSNLLKEEEFDQLIKKEGVDFGVGIIYPKFN